MASDPIIAMFETFNLALILIAFAIFTRLAFKGKSIGSFRFQLSIFLLIWVISETPHIAESIGFLAATGYEDTGLYLHAASMTVFAIFVGWRSLRFLTIHPPAQINTVSIPTDLPKVLKS
ncbi:hypothetical protein E6H31_04375 [Candidatus Bathyarchaeota archaeon]|nr:MAG: hypothetical protein E6H31_04375 [Candidatus Bathyarchaeota archaeon]